MYFRSTWNQIPHQIRYHVQIPVYVTCPDGLGDVQDGNRHRPESDRMDQIELRVVVVVNLAVDVHVEYPDEKNQPEKTEELLESRRVENHQ